MSNTVESQMQFSALQKACLPAVLLDELNELICGCVHRDCSAHDLLPNIQVDFAWSSTDITEVCAENLKKRQSQATKFGANLLNAKLKQIWQDVGYEGGRCLTSGCQMW